MSGDNESAVIISDKDAIVSGECRPGSYTSTRVDEPVEEAGNDSDTELSLLTVTEETVGELATEL